MPDFLLILLGIFMLIYLLRPFATFLHEMGHAIPMILLTGKKATIFVGSYGDTFQSLHFSMGLLEVYVVYNPLVFWKGGLCVPAATEISVNKQIIYILSGPVSSLLVAFVASYAAFRFDSHGAIKFILITFTIILLIDLFISLFPRKFDANGELIANDGQLIADLLKYKKSEKILQQAIDFYAAEEYNKAAVILDKMISKGNKEAVVYRLAISAHHSIGNHDQGFSYFKDLKEQHTLIADDYATMSYVKGILHLEEESLAAADQALLLEPEHDIALNNKGYALLTFHKYEEALVYLERAVAVTQHKAYTFNNLGLAKIKTGNMEGGLRDILYSLELDASNGHAYRNLGIYYLDNGNKEEALKQFEIAIQKDDNIPLIQELMQEAGR